MVTQDEISRADIFLNSIAGLVETLKEGVFDLSDETGFYILATDWLEVASMIESLKENRHLLTPEQRERFGELLNELESVEPVAKRLNLI